jgi:hypothetical protein
MFGSFNICAPSIWSSPPPIHGVAIFGEKQKRRVYMAAARNVRNGSRGGSARLPWLGEGGGKFNWAKRRLAWMSIAHQSSGRPALKAPSGKARSA